MDRERLADLMRRQHGVFTRQQAQGCGYSTYQLRRRIAGGEWRVVIGSALVLPGTRITPRVRDQAAQLCAPGSVLASLSAARIWRLPVPDGDTHLYVAAHAHYRLPGVTFIHEDLPKEDVVMVGRFPMTDRPRTVVDCVRFLPDDAATTLLDRALQQRWLALDDLTRTCQERLGRRGTRRLLRLVAAMVGGERSAAERLLTANLRQHRIGGWVANYEIRDETGVLAIADVAFPARRLILEVDGWAFHTSPGAFQRDRERQNRLVAAGWTVLRFTWRDLSERPEYVVAVVRRLLDRR